VQGQALRLQMEPSRGKPRVDAPGRYVVSRHSALRTPGSAWYRHPVPDTSLPRGSRNLRLRTYDYGQPGGYFVTICTQHRRPLFGEVMDGEMHLNRAGEMALAVWQSLTERFPCIALDAFIVMPNHVHGILLILEEQEGQDLGRIVGTFKSLTTRFYMDGVRTSDWPPFDRRLWQINYYEHVIRGDSSLEQIRTYILGNAARWDDDPERPP